ncbi:signal transduction histidine kinase [Nakamurella sp. UYEF19]|uniref:sensor histidine kinase n=1 Tax=Nakamurella sp. UYEF19 TaxID=1756392 RepID=UPI003395D590
MKPLERLPVRSVRWWAFDASVTLLVAITSLPWWFEADASPLWLAVTAMVLTTAPLVLRRVWPTAVLIWLFVLTTATGWWDHNLSTGVAVMVALYSVAAWGPRRTAIVAAVVLEITGAIALVPLAGANRWYAIAMLTALIIGAVGLGLYRSTRRAYLQELRDRAERLEREKEQFDELAALAERARITREMHDIVAHHLTVMVALSDGAAAAVTRNPAQAQEVMRTVSSTGRQALADTRRLLGVLHVEGEDGRAPLPDLNDVNTLLDGVRAAGLPVSYEIQGTPTPMAPGLQLTLYRLVQETLTNTLKHAGPGVRASVKVRYLPGELLLDVEDDGAGAAAAAPASPGRGLAGMRERVSAYGGTIASGPKTLNGWRVSANLRLDGQSRP